MPAFPRWSRPDGPAWRAHRPRDAHRRLHRPPTGRRVLILMGSGAEKGSRPSPPSNAANESGWCRCGYTGHFPPERCWPRCPRQCARSACWTAPRNPDHSVSHCISTSSRRSPTRTPGRALHVASGVRWTLWPVLEGVHAGNGRRRLRRTGTRKAASPLHRRNRRRRLGFEHPLRPGIRHRVTGHDPRGVLRRGFRRHRRRQQEHHQDPRSRGKPACPGVFRLRLEKVWVADRPTYGSGLTDQGAVSGDRRISLAATTSGSSKSRRARPGRARRDVAAELPAPRRTGLGRTARRVQEQILDKRITLYAVDAGRIAREAGLAGRINIVLQTCFFAISTCCPATGDRRIKESVARRTQPRRRRAEQGTGRGGRRRGRAAPDRGARPGHLHARACPDGARVGAGVRPHRDRGDDGRARKRLAGQRPSGGRHLPERHNRLREAQHFRARRGVGFRTVASSAATAASSARTA